MFDVEALKRDNYTVDTIVLAQSQAGVPADASVLIIAGPTADYLNRAKESARREHETGSKQNGYWLSRLQGAKLLGLDPVVHLLEREKRIDAVTPEHVKQMYVKYFPMNRHTVVSLVPEPK